MKLFEIEKIVLNKYLELDKNEQKDYLIKEVQKIIDNNIKIDMNINDIKYYLELNNYKIDSYVLKLIEVNKINKEELLKNMEVENEKF